MFGKNIKNAGLLPWPKLFQNLRSTRQTELVREYPLHVVCAWLGNKAAIAQKHYLQIRDDDFHRAASVCTTCAVGGESEEIQGNEANESDDGIRVIPDDSESFPLIASNLVGNTGLEPVTPTV